MKKKMMIMVGIVLLVLGAMAGVYAQQEKSTGSLSIKGDDEGGYAAMAKISIESAMNEALKAVPGKVVRTELENENGFLVYGVEIARADRQMADVKVDAGNGKVLKIETDPEENEGHEREVADNDHEENEK